MNATVKLFFETLSQKLPDYKKHLNPPCNPKKFAEIETLIGEKLPEAMRDFYSVTDGEGARLAMGWHFMSLEEIEATYISYAKDYIADAEDYTFSEDSLWLPLNADKVKPFLFHRKWLPIADDNCGGNFFSMDFTPAQKGTKGQIILHSFSGDEEGIYDLATGFENLLEHIIECLKNNSFYVEDNGGLVTSSSIRNNAFYLLPVTTKQKQLFDNLTPKWRSYFESNLTYYGDKEFTLLWLQKWRDTYKLTNDIIENDLSPLLLCPRITVIYFCRERGDFSIDILPELLHLISLGISDASQKDIEIIGNISSLWSLNISTKNVSDFSSLAKLSNLHILTISSDEPADFSVLAGLDNLQTLTISAPQKPDIITLQTLKHIKHLSISERSN